MNVPQCITVVDDGGNLLAFARMDGARVLSIDSSNAKARTAASSRAPSGQVEDPVGIKLAVETIPPLLMAGGRFLLAGAVLYAALRLRGVAAPTRRQWRGGAVTAALLLLGGNGLVGMRERDLLYGGSFDAGPGPDGFVVAASLPLDGSR